MWYLKSDLRFLRKLLGYATIGFNAWERKMRELKAAFDSEESIKTYYSRGLNEIHRSLFDMPDAMILANDKAALVSYFTAEWSLEPVEKDFNRAANAYEEKETVTKFTTSGEYTFHEVRYTIIEFGLILGHPMLK